MSKQHEGFRFWENLEKKSGSQELPTRLNSINFLPFFILMENYQNSSKHSRSQTVGRDGPKTFENRSLLQKTEDRGTGSKEGTVVAGSEPGMKAGELESWKAGELARLEVVVSKLEMEGGAGRGDSGRTSKVAPVMLWLALMKIQSPFLRSCYLQNSNHILYPQVEGEQELLKRLAMATTRIEKSVGLVR